MGSGVLLLLVVASLACKQAVVGAALTRVDFRDLPVAEDIPGLPTDFDFLPHGQTDRILVSGYRGLVQVVLKGVVQKKLFLDNTVPQEVRDKFTGHSKLLDRGLAHEYRAVAIDADFDHNPYVYFSYVLYPERVEGIAPQGFVSRYRVSDDLTEAVISSETVILGSYVNGDCRNVTSSEDNICITRGAHTMGGLFTDPEGNVWISIGDSAFAADYDRPNAMRCQDIDSLYGKVLRVDRNGKGLPGNPYYNGDREANRSKVISSGLRNPWNIHWDAELSTAWLADTGESTLEEFNLVEFGGNYEWPCKESYLDRFQFGVFPECADILGAVPPSSRPAYTGRRVSAAFSYHHTEGTAVTAALKVNIADWPEEFQNGVYFSDYTGNWIKYVKIDRTGKVVSEAFDFASEVPGPVNIRIGSNACLYYLALTASQLGRICYHENNSPPVVTGLVPPNGFKDAARSTLIEVAVSKKVTPVSAWVAITVEETVSGNVVAGSVEQDDLRNVLTFVPNAMLKGATRYTVTVSGLVDFKGKRMVGSERSIFKTGEGFLQYVSDLPLDVEPRLERVALDTAYDLVTPIKIRGRRFRKGLSFTPSVLIDVKVPEGCTSVDGYYGMEDLAFRITRGAIIFTIFADGTLVYDSTVDGLRIPSRKIDPEYFFRLDVKSGSTLTFRGDKGDPEGPLNKDNRAVWADLRFRCGDLDATSPRVESFEPHEGEITSIDTMIRITFDEVMNFNTIIQAVSIKSAAGRRIPWLAIEQSNPQLFVLAVEDLEFDTRYVVSISKVATDVSRNPLEAEVVWSFTTESPAASGEILRFVRDLIPHRSTGGVSSDGFPRSFSPGVQVYDKGLGMRANSMVSYDLSGLGCTRFRGRTGRDAAAGGDAGSCRLQIFSGPSAKTSTRRVDRYHRAAEPSVALDFDLQGDKYLAFKVSAGGDGGRARDFCDIAGTRLKCDKGNIRVADLPALARQGVIERNRSAARLPLQLFRYSMAFDSGISIPAGAEVTYKIPGRCSRVSFRVGAGGGATFGDTKLVTLVDGEPACTEQNFIHRDGAKVFSCSVNGGKELKLLSVKGATKGAIIVGEGELDCAIGTRKPVCDISTLPSSFRVGHIIDFAGQGYRFNGEKLPASAVNWDVTLVHCQPECHDHPEARFEGRKNGSYRVPDHGDYFFIKIDCTVQDRGEISKTSANVLPETAVITVESVPTGKIAAIGDTPGRTPLSKTVVVGSRTTVDIDPVAFGLWDHDNSLVPTFNHKLEDGRPVFFVARFD